MSSVDSEILEQRSGKPTKWAVAAGVAGLAFAASYVGFNVGYGRGAHDSSVAAHKKLPDVAENRKADGSILYPDIEQLQDAIENHRPIGATVLLAVATTRRPEGIFGKKFAYYPFVTKEGLAIVTCHDDNITVRPLLQGYVTLRSAGTTSWPSSPHEGPMLATMGSTTGEDWNAPMIPQPARQQCSVPFGSDTSGKFFSAGFITDEKLP